MKPNLAICLLLFSLFAAEGFGQSVKQIQQAVEADLVKLDKAFDRKLEDLEAAYLVEFEKKTQRAVKDLEAAQKKAMGEQDLEAAIRLRDASKALSEKTPARFQEGILASTFERQNAFTAEFVGKSYTISFRGEKQIWMLDANGYAYKSGGKLKQWFALSKDTVLFVGLNDNQNFDVLTTRKDTGKLELRYLGSLASPTAKHVVVEADSK